MLTPGARLGPYEIVAPLGAGGMGEVWRARDTRLDREVALKFLPDDLAADPDRHARFEREAKVLAALNDPHVATLYGLEHVGERHALVMELVEGEDLAERLARGAIPVDEALAVARQVAEALEAAHEKGIVHRDLKPANVKVRPDGAVKVLDFGLAKALDAEAAGSDLTQSPTVTAGPTRAGMILGTAAYMAPEQARGASVDRRSDIWSFGVVLYEMLAGRRLFAGANVTDVLASVLRQEIDLSALPRATPVSVRRLLRRCLERDLRDRLHDIGDARLALEDALRGEDGASAGPGDASTAPPSRGRRTTVPWLVGVVLTAVVAAIAGYRASSRGGAPREPMHLAMRLEPGQEMMLGNAGPLAFDPDGRSLIISGSVGGKPVLLRRALDQPQARPVAGTEGGFWGAMSPDGRWVAFSSGSVLRKVAAEGGRPFDLAEAHPGMGATWLADGTLVFAPFYSDGLFRVSADGGASERLTTPDHGGGELGHSWPDALPGGRKVVFTAFRTPVDTSRIGVLDLATRKVDWVVENGFFARYVRTGHLLFARGERLFAVPFDPRRGWVTGPAVAVVDDLYVSQVGGFGVFAVSSRGDLAYLSEAVGDPPSELVWVDRSGRTQVVPADRRRYQSVQLSPDGREVAVSILDDSADLWLYSLERGTLSRLTSSPKTEFDPVWSADGRELYYVLDRPTFDLERIPVDRPDAGTPIWNETPPFDRTHIALAPDGRWAAYTQNSQTTGRDLYVRPLDGSEPARPFRATRAEEDYACFSPDGRWIVYQSNETGRPEIYVEAFPGPGERFQVSADGGSEPVWTRGSREIFFRHGDDMCAIQTHLGGAFAFEKPRTLFSLSFMPGDPGGARVYDVTADGSRILVIRVPDASVPRQVEIVTDWAGVLRKLAPEGAR